MRIFRPLNQDYKDRCKAYIDTLSPHYEIVVREHDPDKTDLQRRKWHAILSEVGNKYGFTKGQVKHAVKAEFYGLEDYVIDGKTYTHCESSEDSKRGEYSRLIDFTYQWCSERGFVIDG